MDKRDKKEKNEVREDRFTWKAGDVTYIPPKKTKKVKRGEKK